MSPTASDRPREAAVERLRALGLSAYAARTFVALVALGEGSAQDVSEVADVPRTRVYDAAEELRQESLVDVYQSSPKRFHPVSIETAGRRFDRKYRDHVRSLTVALRVVEPASAPVDQHGVWTVTGGEAVTDRVLNSVRTADETVAFATAEDLLTDGVVEALRSATDRGVRVRLVEPSRPSDRAVRDAVPGAEPFESLWDWHEIPVGRLLIVDGQWTLVSVLATGDESPPVPDETAIWGSGDENGLVAVLRALFAWQAGDD